MLTQNFIENLPAFIGLLITSSWLIYTSLRIAYNLDLIQVTINWLSNKKILLPSLATLISPFLFMYVYKIVPLLVDKWRLREFIGILGAVTGVILGFLVSEFRQWKTELQQFDTVRTMLRIEIKQDLELLNELRQKIKQSSQPIDFFRDNPPPQWNPIIWKNQVLLLPLAFTTEEINQIYKLYNEFDDVIKNYSILRELISEYNDIPDKIQMSLEDTFLLDKKIQLSAKIRTKLIEFYNTIREILDRYKNPLV
ncbi:hypothetical protein H6G81_35425 [Scytonema hofmannii FACHB-248]|uniref:Uncharacterized protein n=1 Tax=Scytonema hofmannii FACHB-248 TaxID=1842502 RepID=A0ABR8H2G3_9CYAN|nr:MULTISPECIES: hypothetical protein [Nostocales]MBD2609638.1 hypothetical protein [Scytonema hofmannii FACHB-248]